MTALGFVLVISGWFAINILFIEDTALDEPSARLLAAYAMFYCGAVLLVVGVSIFLLRHMP